MTVNDQSDDIWTFGQLLPVVLLAAPLVTFLEAFFPGIFNLNHSPLIVCSLMNATADSDQQKSKETLPNAFPHINSRPLASVDPVVATNKQPCSLDDDCYSGGLWFKILSALILLYTTAATALVLCLAYLGLTVVDAGKQLTIWFCLEIPLSIFIFATLSLSVQRISTPKFHFIKHWSITILLAFILLLLRIMDNIGTALGKKLWSIHDSDYHDIAYYDYYHHPHTVQVSWGVEELFIVAFCTTYILVCLCMAVWDFFSVCWFHRLPVHNALP